MTRKTAQRKAGFEKMFSHVDMQNQANLKNKYIKFPNHELFISRLETGSIAPILSFLFTFYWFQNVTVCDYCISFCLLW